MLDSNLTLSKFWRYSLLGHYAVRGNNKGDTCRFSVWFPCGSETQILKGSHFVFLRGGWLEICKQDDLAGIANRLPRSSCIYYSCSLLKDACKMWLTWHAVVEGVQDRGSAELVQWTGHWNNQSTDKIQEKMLNLEIIYLWNYVQQHNFLRR